LAAETDLVSVILPVYNGLPWLADAVRSIRAQTHRHWELIAVDDGSADGSGDHLREAGAADDRIRIVTHPANRGISAAYNSGLAVARGRYVAFQEQDDISLPGRLERQLAVMRELGVPIVSTRVGLLDRAGSVYATWPDDLGEAIEVNPPGYRLGHRILHSHTNIANSSLFLDRNAIVPGDLQFDEQFRRCCQDADLHVRLSLRYASVRLPEVLVHVRRFPEQDSATAYAAAMLPDMRRLLAKYVPRLRAEAPLAPAVQTMIRAWSTQLHFEAACRGGNWRGFSLLLLGLLLWPGNPRILRTLRNRLSSKPPVP
jgi:glycosyltransferase involved in cell wall biosynthesis